MLPFGANFCCASAAFGVTIEPALAAAAPIVTPSRFMRSRRVTCSAMGLLLRSALCFRSRGEKPSPSELAALHHGGFRSVKAGDPGPAEIARDLAASRRRREIRQEVAAAR